jgi:type I restriction enzyme R subunit
MSKDQAVGWEKLDDELVNDAKVPDRDIVSADQIRTVVRAFKWKLFTKIFPGWREVPRA